MKAGWMITLAAGMAIGVAAPAHLEAQGNSNRSRQQAERQREQERDRTRREEDRRERERLERLANERGMVIRRNDDDRRRDRRDDRYDRRDDRYDRRDRYDPWDARRNDRYDRRGPAFCRNGEGHPVHGRQWCRNKGFGLGNERARDIWGDIIYRDRRYDNRMMNQSALERILGSVVLNRFGDYGRTYYGNGSLNGRWLDNRATTLQLFIGSTPIARLIDTNRDGRVDSVSLMR